MTAPHDPARPDITSMRATLATARAILTGVDPEAVHDYASVGPGTPAVAATASPGRVQAFAAALTDRGPRRRRAARRRGRSSWSTSARPTGSMPRRRNSTGGAGEARQRAAARRILAVMPCGAIPVAAGSRTRVPHCGGIPRPGRVRRDARAGQVARKAA